MSETIDYRSIKDFLGRPIPPEGELRIWLDDDLVDRPAPPGWTHVRSVREACFALLSGRVVEVSLDNDLNNACIIDGDSDDEIAQKNLAANENLFGTGYQVIDFLEDQHFACGNPLWPKDGIAIHSANPDARDRMKRGIEAVARQDGAELEISKRSGERAVQDSGDGSGIIVRMGENKTFHDNLDQLENASPD